jgi:hypothetical protein
MEGSGDLIQVSGNLEHHDGIAVSAAPVAIGLDHLRDDSVIHFRKTDIH